MTAPTAATAVQTDNGARLYERTMCLSLSITRFGLSRKASMEKVSVRADKKLLTMSKRLLRSKNYGFLSTEATRIRDVLRDIALPSMFKSSTYLVPIDLVETVEERLNESKIVFEQHVAAFVEEYPAAVEKIREDLGDLYDAKNYPPSEVVLAAFSFEWQYVSFDVPGRLRTISKALFESEREKQAAKLRMAGDEVRMVLREGAAALVAAMAERLKPTEDGKKRALRESTVQRLQEFLATFDLRNVTDDGELATVVEQAKLAMRGIDVEQLRADDDLRKRVLSSFEQVSASLDPLIVNRRTRAISLED